MQINAVKARRIIDVMAYQLFRSRMIKYFDGSTVIFKCCVSNPVRTIFISKFAENEHLSCGVSGTAA